MSRKILDLTGQPFGHLIVIQRSTTEHQHIGFVWQCKCTNCGTHIDVPTKLLTSGKKRSCGKPECRYKRSTLDKDKRTVSPISIIKLNKDRMNRGRISIATLSNEDKGIILQEYINGLSVLDICESYGITQDSLDRWINTQRDTFNSTHEIRLLNSLERMPLIARSVETALKTRYTSEELLSRLSPDDSETLSDSELVYAWTFDRTNNNNLALQESGLDECLKGSLVASKVLLGMYIREKPNVAQFLRQIKEFKREALVVDKQGIQLELIEQIEQLKEIIATDGGSGNSRVQLLKAVEMLGKSIGAFTENVNITEIKANEALDRLLEMAKCEIVSDDRPCEIEYEVKSDE